MLSGYLELNFLAERPSPSSPQEQAEPRLEAGEGLDVTDCSALPFTWGGFFKMIMNGLNPIKYLIELDRHRRVIEYRRANACEWTLLKNKSSHLTEHNDCQNHQ
jgi:hypothetical protein